MSKSGKPKSQYEIRTQYAAAYRYLRQERRVHNTANAARQIPYGTQALAAVYNMHTAVRTSWWGLRDALAERKGFYAKHFKRQSLEAICDKLGITAHNCTRPGWSSDGVEHYVYAIAGKTVEVVRSTLRGEPQWVAVELGSGNIYCTAYTLPMLVRRVEKHYGHETGMSETVTGKP